MPLAWNSSVHCKAISCILLPHKMGPRSPEESLPHSQCRCSCCLWLFFEGRRINWYKYRECSSRDEFKHGHPWSNAQGDKKTKWKWNICWALLLSRSALFCSLPLLCPFPFSSCSSIFFLRAWPTHLQLFQCLLQATYVQLLRLQIVHVQRIQRYFNPGHQFQWHGIQNAIRHCRLQIKYVSKLQECLSAECMSDPPPVRGTHCLPSWWTAAHWSSTLVAVGTRIVHLVHRIWPPRDTVSPDACPAHPWPPGDSWMHPQRAAAADLCTSRRFGQSEIICRVSK